MHLTALRNGVAYAHSRRYAEDDERNANRRALPHGFAAYDVWQQAFTSADMPVNGYPPSPRDAHVQAGCRRGISARACRTSFLKRLHNSKAAANHYDREMEALNPLHDLCDAACDREAWLAEERVRAQQFIGDALESDREAIACVEAAFTMLKET